mgnify:CR=1 FL=1
MLFHFDRRKKSEKEKKPPRFLVLRRKWLTLGAAVLAAAAIFAAVNYPAAVSASAATRQLPIYCVQRDQKVCSISFDAAWGADNTQKILDVLKEKNAPGMFFLVGHYVDTAEDVIRRMIDEGHLLGNHTNNHPDLTTVDAQTFVKELTDLEDKVKAKFPDAPPMRYMRPPEGACNEWSLAMAKKMDYTTVLWSWGHHDWVENDQPDPASALEKAKQGLHPGAVYLFHCVGSTNPAILGDLIDYIRAQGYEIHPLCD